MSLSMKKMVVGAGVVAALGVFSTAWADQSRRESQNSGRQSAPEHATGRREAAPAPAPRQNAAPAQAPAPRQAAPQASPRREPAPAPRQVAPTQRQNPAPRAYQGVDPRSRASQGVDPRGRVQSVQPRGPQSYDNRYDQRGSAPQYQYRSNNSIGSVGRAIPRTFRSRTIVVAPRASFHVSRPYYSFRPRFSLGLGLFVGYPTLFPTWYDPYAYAYSYPDVNSYSYAAPSLRYGGVSFDIQPNDADVYVDGEYVGAVGDFSPYDAPLTLAAGTHHIELQARGFAPMAFDITVVPGQVIPYQGTLSYR